MNKTAAIVTGILVIGGGGAYLYYNSRRNQAEGTALLEYINKSVDQTNKTKGAEEQIKNVQSATFRLDPNRIRIGRLSGKLTDPPIRNAFAKANVDIRTSILGIGTDTKTLLPTLGGLKSKNAVAMMDKVMKAQYGEGLFEMLKGEKKMYNHDFCNYSEKTSSNLGILFPTLKLTGGCWTPWFADWLYNLPDY